MAKQLEEPVFLKKLREFSLSEPGFRVWTLTFGEHLSRRKGEGIEFNNYRPYEPGEDIAMLDIEATLRTGEKLIRENLTEEKVRYVLILDDSASLRFYKMREAAFIALGCYLLSAVKERDPARIITVGRNSIAEISEPVYSAEEALTLLLNLWKQEPAKHAVKSELLNFMTNASRPVSLLSTRIVFISDLAFTDVGPGKVNKKKIVFRGRDVFKQALGGLLREGGFCELTVLGIAPEWKSFLALRGFFRIRDAESGSTGLVRFTQKSAAEFVRNQQERESLWKETARSLNIPLSWLHAGDNVLSELESSLLSFSR